MPPQWLSSVSTDVKQVVDLILIFCTCAPLLLLAQVLKCYYNDNKPVPLPVHSEVLVYSEVLQPKVLPSSLPNITVEVAPIPTITTTTTAIVTETATIVNYIPLPSSEPSGTPSSAPSSIPSSYIWLQSWVVLLSVAMVVMGIGALLYRRKSRQLMASRRQTADLEAYYTPKLRKLEKLESACQGIKEKDDCIEALKHKVQSLEEYQSRLLSQSEYDKERYKRHIKKYEEHVCKSVPSYPIETLQPQDDDISHGEHSEEDQSDDTGDDLETYSDDDAPPSQFQYPEEVGEPLEGLEVFMEEQVSDEEDDDSSVMLITEEPESDALVSDYQPPTVTDEVEENDFLSPVSHPTVSDEVAVRDIFSAPPHPTGPSEVQERAIPSPISHLRMSDEAELRATSVEEEGVQTIPEEISPNKDARRHDSQDRDISTDVVREPLAVFNSSEPVGEEEDDDSDSDDLNWQLEEAEPEVASAHTPTPTAKPVAENVTNVSFEQLLKEQPTAEEEDDDSDDSDSIVWQLEEAEPELASAHTPTPTTDLIAENAESYEQSEQQQQQHEQWQQVEQHEQHHQVLPDHHDQQPQQLYQQQPQQLSQQQPEQHIQAQPEQYHHGQHQQQYLVQPDEQYHDHFQQHHPQQQHDHEQHQPELTEQYYQQPQQFYHEQYQQQSQEQYQPLNSSQYEHQYLEQPHQQYPEQSLEQYQDQSQQRHLQQPEHHFQEQHFVADQTPFPQTAVYTQDPDRLADEIDMQDTPASNEQEQTSSPQPFLAGELSYQPDPAYSQRLSFTGESSYQPVSTYSPQPYLAVESSYQSVSTYSPQPPLAAESSYQPAPTYSSDITPYQPAQPSVDEDFSQYMSPEFLQSEASSHTDVVASLLAQLSIYRIEVDERITDVEELGLLLELDDIEADIKSGVTSTSDQLQAIIDEHSQKFGKKEEEQQHEQTPIVADAQKDAENDTRYAEIEQIFNLYLEQIRHRIEGTLMEEQLTKIKVWMVSRQITTADDMKSELARFEYMVTTWENEGKHEGFNTERMKRPVLAAKSRRGKSVRFAEGS